MISNSRSGSIICGASTHARARSSNKEGARSLGQARSKTCKRSLLLSLLVLASNENMLLRSLFLCDVVAGHVGISTHLSLGASERTLIKRVTKQLHDTLLVRGEAAQLADQRLGSSASLTQGLC